MARIKLTAACAIAAIAGQVACAQSVLTNAFTYQGELASGGLPATGSYDMRFTLFNDASPLGTPVCADGVVVTDGRFEVVLDFGASFIGLRRYLQIEVREDAAAGNCAVAAGYVALAPRQELTATPHASLALSAVNSLLLNNQPAAFYTNASNLTSGTIPDARLSTNIMRLNAAQTVVGAMTFTNPANTFVGNGAALTALNASNIAAGTLSDARLSPNVAMLDRAQVFTGANTFASLSNIFAGDGAGLVNLDAANIGAGTLADARLSSNIARLSATQTFLGNNFFNSPANSFNGNGAGLTNLNAANLSVGVVADARLPLTIGRLTSAQTWTGANTFSSASNNFTGRGSGLTLLNASNISSGTLNVDRLPPTSLLSDVSATVSADYTFSGAVGVGAAPVAFGQLNVATTRLRGINATNTSAANGSAAVYAASTASTGIVYAGYFTSDSDLGAAVSSNASATSAITGFTTAPGIAAIAGTNNTDSAIGVLGTTITTTGTGYGVRGLTSASVGAAVHGQSESPTGAAHGVWGAALSPSARGVLAANSAPGGVALEAHSSSFSGSGKAIYARARGDTGVGVHAVADAATGATMGVFGSVTSPAGWAGYFVGRAYFSSRVGIGTASPSALLHLASAGNEPVMRATINGSPSLFMDQAGQLGLGTEVPTARLHVNAQVGEPAMRVQIDGSNTLTVRDEGVVIGGLSGNPPESGMLVDGNIVLRGNDLSLSDEPDLWIGPGSNEPGLNFSHVAINATDTMYLMSMNSGGSPMFRVANDGGVTVGSNALAPARGMHVFGDVDVVGSLSKGGGSFKIDHPLDPQNKLLYHSFVESPDMMNIYNGNVVTGADGRATIQLPDYFEALNQEFRYQLTVIGEEVPDVHFVRVTREVEGNTFSIKSTPGNLKVSWQVTGIRHDAWARKNRIPNTVDKAGDQRGKLIHPEAFQPPAAAGEPVRSSAD